MDDLISRKDAIDALNIAMNIWSSMPEWREHKIIECLEELPSAEPDVPDINVSDMISRQAAIDTVGSMLRRKFGIGGDLAEITLAGLPSAQPDLQPTCNQLATDTISRQAALDLIEKAPINGWVKDALIGDVRALPSAQPEPEHTMEEFMYGQDLGSPEDGSL